MIIDSRLEFSDAQAVTTDAVSTNVIDLSQDRDIGPGRHMWVVVAVEVAADNTTGDETYSFELQTDDNEGFSSATTIATVAPAASTLTAGQLVVIGFPFENERFLRMNYNTGGTTPSITVSAWLTDQDPTAHRAYPDGNN